ncbi:MAG: ABC transporter ATP-binding protein [Dehalococcoidia bacterium]|nr:ABC transporter ATP-binding protein [Dehalococcoidia bacterium]
MTVLDVVQLSKRYRNGTLANDRLDLAVAAGELFGLLGPNGAGKTTLVRQVLGLLRPSAGGIRVQGVDVVANPGYARKAIGFLPQGQFQMQAIQVEEMIFYTAKLRGVGDQEARRRTAAIIAQLDLGAFRRTRLAAASGGVQRLCGVASAIVGGASFLVLDEPTNDIDPVRRQLLWRTLDALRREGTTILLVTHNLAEAERVLDRFAIIDRGRILQQGTPAALRSLVSDRLRLELSAVDGLVPHPALQREAAGAYLFAPEDLPAVSAWLKEERESGRLVDFRIGPPTLEDIYAAALGPPSLEPVR